jgi:hypothetical protein
MAWGPRSERGIQVAVSGEDHNRFLVSIWPSDLNDDKPWSDELGSLPMRRARCFARLALPFLSFREPFQRRDIFER